MSYGIAGESHQQGEYGTAKETHNHEAAHLILLFRYRQQGLGEDHGEYIGVTISHQGDGDIEHRLGLSHQQAYHAEYHHHHTDDEEGASLHHSEEECSGETTQSTEDEIQTGGESGLVECPSQALHEYLGSSGVGTHIYAHMAHDAHEGEQHHGLAKQGEAVSNG